jgi:hypothetical protein
MMYGFYIDDEGGKMTVVAVHPDSASLELHMDIGRAEFRKLAHLVTLTAIECYGQPSERALEQLRRKAATLGNGGTVVSIGSFAGFAHSGSTPQTRRPPAPPRGRQARRPPRPG